MSLWVLPLKDNVDCTWSENVDEGVLSRIDDPNDYMIDPSYFQYIDDLWGPHKQTDIVADIVISDVRWLTIFSFLENNWLFCPPFLIPLVLRHMSAGGADGTLIPQRLGALYFLR